VATDRLDAQYPSVGAALNAVQSARLVEMARNVATATVAECGIAWDCQRADDPVALVASLDDEAWNARDKGDDAAYDRAFRRARAADTWARAMAVADRDSAAEVLYEAVHALGGDVVAEDTVIHLMRS
jgi:hypothetical protein